MRFALIATLALAATACSNQRQDQYEGQLREALNKADVSLGEAIVIAENNPEIAYGARLEVVGDSVFTVRAAANHAATRYSISLSGELLAADSVGQGGTPCGSLSLQDLAAIAEAEVSGQATSIEPDDDGGCAFEVQVLTSQDLMEVKVSGSGDVLEVETSDEDGSGEDG
ncbi:MAG: hypothetical protein R3B72_31255 [Polyangiaceae bacterium]